MIWHPKVGQQVELAYRKELRAITGLHGLRGVVLGAARGPGPINALVRLDDGRLTCIPRGNLLDSRA